MELVVAGVKPYDGTYELDLEQELTTREWGWIKRLAGYLPMAVTDEAFGDPELACALTVIAMRRAGRSTPARSPACSTASPTRRSAPPSPSTGDHDEEQAGEGDDRPPVAGPSSNASTSGDASPTSSETPAAPPSPTGTPASATSVSAPLTLAT
jgi:hypothetical protein